MSLTRQVALLSLIPMVVLGLALARVLQSQIVTRTLSDESQAARLIARIGIQPQLSPRGLHDGLSPATIRALDAQLRTASVKRDLARIKIWNATGTVVYSDDHSLIGRRLTPSDDLENALDGHPNDAAVVNPRPHTETAGEVGLGTLVEVYVPLRFRGNGRPDGAFEMYLSYRPIAGAISGDKTTIAIVVGIGLALLWLVLFRIVARASRRLRRHARESYRLARFDQLTSLPNRTLFTERVGLALGRGGEEEAGLAVLMIDLEDFKQVNSTLGKATGDRVLREVARRLRGALGADTLLARLGNDEFAILARGCAGPEGARREAERVHRALEEPLALDGIALNVEASVGIALARGGRAGAEELSLRAESALARARSGGSRIEVYSPERDRFDADRLRLLGEVRGALEHGEFALHYQPKLDLASGRISGVEALLRWAHPERGLLSPMAFLPVIEPTALIGPLTLFVVEQAARQLRSWREQGVDLEVSVNLSARNLLDEELPATIFAILRHYGVSPGQVTFEVTESAAMSDPEKAIAVLRALRAGGCGVSIDDFGTGNASIEYLARLPASELKIDRSFVTDICEDPRAEAIVRATIDLARNLNLSVVAEGIETDAELERVAELGCQTGQGYLISRPLPAQELTVQLRRRKPALGVAG